MDEELKFMAGFAEGHDMRYAPAPDQLRSLWTAYVLHKELWPDTAAYDAALRTVWEHADKGDPGWGYDSFEGFMTEHLV